MKIVIIAHAFPPYVGGLSYVVKNLSVNLAKKGFDVEVVTLDIDGNLPKYEEYRVAVVRRFRGYAPDGCYFVPSMECIKYLKNLEADIVHVHNIGSLLTLFAINVIRKRGGRPKIVVTPHHHEGGSKWHTKLGWVFYKPIARKALKKADVVHAVSNYEFSLIRKDFGVEPIVIPNGVSEDVFSYRWNPPKDRVVITYAGRVEKYKRVDLIIEIAHKLSKIVKEKIVVRIIGRGSDLQRILKLAKQHGIEIEVLGFLPRDEYLETISKTTIFMNLSRYEAYSIVTAEALAIGVPAIIAKPWGLNFKGMAFIVDLNDKHQMVKTITGVLNDLDSISITSSGHDSIESWNIVTEKLIRYVYK